MIGIAIAMVGSPLTDSCAMGQVMLVNEPMHHCKASQSNADDPQLHRGIQGGARSLILGRVGRSDRESGYLMYFIFMDS